MIAEGLASAQATQVLLILTDRFDPERDEAIWAIGGLGGGSFSVETRKGEMVAIEELKGKLSVPDLHDFEDGGYIRVHKKQESDIWAFRPTQRARDLQLKDTETPKDASAAQVGPLDAGGAVRLRLEAPGEDVTRTQPAVVGSPGADSLVGRTIDRWLFQELVKTGGMGQIYRGLDTKLGRKVAIKTIRTALVADADARARFEREAKVVALLNHPGIITLHDLGVTPANDPFLVLEYLDGDTLQTIIEKGPMSLGTALRLVVQVANGLSAAHSAGIIHRDLKPSNIMVSHDGHAKILDFGLALLDPSLNPEDETPAQLTKSGEIRGSLGYTAPEQLRGNRADSRADIFALGVIFYYAVTGVQPFLRGTDLATHLAVLNDPVSPLHECIAAPLALSKVIADCLAKDPQGRPQTARDLVSRLDDHLGGEKWVSQPSHEGAVMRAAAEGDGSAADTRSLPQSRPATLQIGDIRAEASDTESGTRETHALAIRNSSATTLQGKAVIVSADPPIPGLPLDATLKTQGFDGPLFLAFPSNHPSLFVEVVTCERSVRSGVGDKWSLALAKGPLRLPIQEWTLRIAILGGPEPAEATVYVYRGTIMGEMEVSFDPPREPFEMRHGRFGESLRRELVESQRALERGGAPEALSLVPFFDEKDPSCIHRNLDGLPDRYRVGLRNTGSVAARDVSARVESCDVPATASVIGRRFHFEHSGALEETVPVSDSVVVYLDLIQLAAEPGNLLLCEPPVLLPPGDFSIRLVILVSSGDLTRRLALTIVGVRGRSDLTILTTDVRSPEPGSIGGSPNDGARARLDASDREKEMGEAVDGVGVSLQTAVGKELEILLAEAKGLGILHASSHVERRAEPGPVFSLTSDDRYRRHSLVHSISYGLWSSEQTVNLGGWVQVEVPRAAIDPLLLRHSQTGGATATLASVSTSAADDTDQIGTRAARDLWASLMAQIVERVEAKRRESLR